ncbi:MAG: cation:proton antiporter subunit C [Defluviitaleaceae bacterium]|nr:cation:proton antiporter subunit C [Defluviitaleaceae bacterium]
MRGVNAMFGMATIEFFAIALFFIAIFGLVTSNNAIKSIVFMTILNAAVITFWIGIGAREGTLPPIMETPYHIYMIGEMSDPVPQALMITAIVIGFSVTAINIIMMNTLFRRYKTSDWKSLYKMMREETAGSGQVLSDIVFDKDDSVEEGAK